MANLGTPELLIIAFVVILLFGTKKLPDAARSVGRSLRIFKAETKGLTQDDQTAAAAQPQAQPQAAPAPRPIESGQTDVAPKPAQQPAAGVASSANGQAVTAGDVSQH
ncbi:Sec-independent protein translocase subunit TatA [Frankia sp. Cas3]|uniref:Sec-independent protein translocase subunit TatA n=1 Tax=Frankia sp. Cas3 TaxID=3073926 RepID=UPI002AD44D7B|nr:Sec-independent protein translocase subunit TatA [Frankia sp. Cas3]